MERVIDNCDRFERGSACVCRNASIDVIDWHSRREWDPDDVQALVWIELLFSGRVFETL